MKPESVERIKQLMDARGALLSAVEQYIASTGSLERALESAKSIMTACHDAIATRQVVEMQGLVNKLSRTLRKLEGCGVIAETLEVLAHEVTVHEEHVPAGVS